MIPEAIFKNDNIFFREDTVGGIPCTIGYRKEFRWSWAATQLNVMVFIGHSDKTIDKLSIENFSTACYNYALKNHKGWPRGLQAAVASIAILQGASISNDAINFCERFSKKHWSAFEIPVLYNTVEKRGIRFVSNPVWGALYIPVFTKMADTITYKLGID